MEEEIAASEEACSSDSSPTASDSTADTAGDDFFIKHKVSGGPSRLQDRSESECTESRSASPCPQVRKRDTLAGLAVHYKVTVSRRARCTSLCTALWAWDLIVRIARSLPTQVADIKRANGFHNESAMFGKDTLLIPTKPLPLG
jgi:hypothetical protein